MKVLALDIWNDLRTKRLWPVALLLAAGLVAALAFALSSGAEEPPAPAAAVTGGAGAPDAAGVRVTEEPLGGSSNLEKFHPRDPFSGGPRSVDPTDTGASGTPGDAAEVLGGGGQTPGPVTGDVATDGIGASSSEPPSPPVPAASGASSPPPTTGSSNAGASAGDSEPTSQPRTRAPRPEIRYVSFEADVKFGPVGETRPYRGLDGLTLLPGPRKPMVLFSGVATDGRTGIFTLLHPSLEVKGECIEIDGACAPVVLLEQGDRQRIMGADGKRYMVHLVDVRRTRVDG